MAKRIHKIRQSRGAAGMQYATVIGLIGVVALFAVSQVGSVSRTLMTNVANRLGTAGNVSGPGGGGGGGSGGGGGGGGPSAGAGFYFFSNGALYRSTDGITFSEVTTSGLNVGGSLEIYNLTAIGGKLYAGGGIYNSAGPDYYMPVAASSSDGTNWTYQTVHSTTADYVFGVAGAGTVTALTGYYETYISSGGAFTAGKPDTGDFLGTQIGYGAGRYFTEEFWSSADGINWTQASGINYSTQAGDSKPRYLNGYFFIAGSTGGTAHISRSSDGQNWTGIAHPCSSSFYQPSDFASNGSRIIAVGFQPSNNTQCSLLYSDDNGATWNIKSSNYVVYGNWSHAAWGNNMFVGAPSNGIEKVHYSADGLNWTRSTVPGSVGDVGALAYLP